MIVDVNKSEVAKIDNSCEIRLGVSSWSNVDKSIKYCWHCKDGKIAMGGEIPVKALPQMVRMALQHGYITFQELFAQ